MRTMLSGLTLVASMLLAPPGQAQDEGVTNILACAHIVEDAARLACYDRAVAGYDDERARIAAAGATQDARATETARQEEAKARFGAEALPREAQERLGVDTDKLDEVTVVIVEMGRNPWGKFFIVTEDGQIWRQKDDRSMPFGKMMKAAVIKRGFLGSFRLTFPEIGRTYTVERVR
ncbi:MAG: hypothetical protein ACOY99_01860 [Pseudomonadota bacterium]